MKAFKQKEEEKKIQKKKKKKVKIRTRFASAEVQSSNHYATGADTRERKTKYIKFSSGNKGKRGLWDREKEPGSLLVEVTNSSGCTFEVTYPYMYIIEIGVYCIICLRI